MSSSDRRAFLVTLAGLPLAACGFAPAYAPGGPASGLLDRVEIDPPADKNEFDLVERLEDRLGRTRAGRWRLSYRIATRTAGLAITPESATTRYNLLGEVDFSLTEIATGRVATSGKVSNFTAWSAAGTTVSTAASAEDAAERLMRMLADQIVTRLIATSAGWGAA